MGRTTKHDWKLECPRVGCGYKETYKTSTRICENCHNKDFEWVSYYWYGMQSGQYDHRLRCTRCGNEYCPIICPKCGAEISGQFIGREQCFLTTAACAMNGRSDDCVELSMARRFRDRHLHVEYDKDTFDRLYRLASEEILEDKSCRVFLKRAFHSHIVPAVHLVGSGDYEGANARFLLLLNGLNQVKMGKKDRLEELVKFLK